MATGAAARIIRSPGRLVVNPTQAFNGGTYPYGGTEVGKVNLCMMLPLGVPFNVEYESLGEVGDVLEGDNRYVFACFLRGWDDDAVENLLSAGYEAGAVTQHAVYFEPGGVSPGESAIPRGIILAFIPDDPIHVPGCLIYRGIPDWGEGAEVAFQRKSELGIPLAVECIRDANDNIFRIGRLPDLDLT